MIFVSVLALTADLFSHFFWSVNVLIFISIAGLLPVIFNAVKSLFARHLTIDLLASIALIFSLLAREWRSAIFIGLMLASARMLTRYTSRRARRSIQGLLKLRPTKVHLFLNNQPVETEVEKIKVGDLILVESGERIAVDGVVESGQANIDQSSLTGESEPVDKKTGDEVLSSTLNISGSLIVRATRVGEDTVFSKILELVEKSHLNKAIISSVVEKFTGRYIFFTLVGAVLIYLISHNLMLVLSILLVTCADDLAVAIPLTFTAAIGAMAKRGTIVKGGIFFEGLNKLGAIIFDKTGTITEGRPQICDVQTFEGFSRQEFLELLGAAENESDHPAARAVQKFIAQENIKIAQISRVHEEPGFGMRGLIEGKEVLAGKTKFLRDNGVLFSPQENNLIDDQKDKQRTVTVLGIDKKPVGFVAFSDAIRPTAALAIKEMKALGVQRTIMLTGDNEVIAQDVAQKVGITEFRANLLPKEKVDFLKSFLSPSYKVAMVGDGANDAAALALADIGVAMGASGVDSAIESADIILMKDDLLNLPDAIKLGRATAKIVNQDLWIWGAVNGLGLALVFLGILKPSGAAAYNFLTDFLPILNSMRAFRIHFKSRRVPVEK